MPFTNFVGVLTLAPAACGLLALVVGVLKRPLAPLVLALAVVGAVIPAICLIFLARDLTTGEPLLTVMFGGGSSASGGFTPGYRFDAFSLYAALGIAYIITPLLLWLAWLGGRSAAEATDADELADEEETVDVEPASSGGFLRGMTPAPLWGGVALALGIETAALTLVFADNALWLTLSWLVLVALVWALGEIGSDLAIIDRVGLVMTLVGPVAWMVVMLFATHKVKTLSLADLVGRSGFNAISVVLFAFALALAGGAYPFIAWVRRRAALISPAGLGALLLITLPAALYVGARTFGAGHDINDLWPQIGKATPPITGGIAFTALGAVSVAIVGMLALERRDVRALVAYLAVAQIGWGMIALGIGTAIGALAVITLLATTTLGLGAMLAASVAGGTLTADIEPEGAGPHVFGMPVNPAGLIIWCLGAITLVGAPLMGGFTGREIVSAAAINAGGLSIPLVGLAWAGDAVLAIALVRATAPAFSEVFAPRDEEPFVIAESAEDDDTLDEDFDETDAEDGADTEEAQAERPGSRFSVGDLRYAPGALIAALALIVGVAPQLLFRFGGLLAGNALLQSSGLDATTHLTLSGYSVGTGQWLPVLSWLAVIVLVALLGVLIPRGQRVAKPGLVGETKDDDPERGLEMAGLAEPADAWDELAPAMQSMWTLPGSLWLLAGTDEDEEPPLADGEHTPEDEDADDVEEDEGVTAEADETEVDEEDVAEPKQNGAKAQERVRQRGRRTGDKA